MTVKRLAAATAAILLTLALVAGCSSDSDSSATDSGGSDSAEVKPVSLALPWYPIPEFGGVFAALQQGYFEDIGVEMEIMPGTPGVSVTQLVGVGQADMALANTDNNLVLARQEGVPLKGVATTFQTYPGGAVFHAEKPAATAADLNGRSFYAVPGQFDTDWLVSQFGLEIERKPYSEDAWRADPNGVINTWTFNMAPKLDAAGVEWDAIQIADTGYNSYALVLFTSDSFLEENRELMSEIVVAINKGWDYYRENFHEVNQFMYDFDDSKTSPVEQMDQTAEMQEDFYVDGDNAFSTIDPERFEERLTQMQEAKVLKSDMAVEDVLDLTVNPAQPAS